MGPLIEALASTPRVALVPGGLLEFFPLHAAWREDPNNQAKRRYAMETITFTSIPNARAFTAVQARATHTVDALLAVDDPLPVRNPLKTAGYEVEVAGALFPRYQRLRHEQATLEHVRAALPTYPVVHFNGHGSANLLDPLESGLVMANEQILTLREILNMRLSATRLAVLSACETALAGIKVPDEVISLPMGLLQAGVAGVVASLWKVEASSTMVLMNRFYELWRREKMSPPDALRKAQLWLRDTATVEKLAYIEGFQGNAPPVALPADLAWQLYWAVFSSPPINYAHPFYWAAFSYTGC
jgi:CHAT domain-containing protein